MSTASRHRSIQFSCFRRSGVAALLALHAVMAMAQSGAPRAELPTFKVGDRWKFEQTDRRTGIKESEHDLQVTSVSPAQIEGNENGEKFSWSPDLTPSESAVSTFPEPPKLFSFPLEVGKKWDYKSSWVNKKNTGKGRQQMEVIVVGYEKVKVPAGEFDAYKIETKGFWNNDANRRNGSMKVIRWYAPAARASVRIEYDDGYNNWVRQLVEMQLQP